MVSQVSRWFVRLGIVALVGGWWPEGWLQAERPTAPYLLPDKTLVYVRVADAQEAISAFQSTAFGRMFQDEQVRPLIQKLYQSAAEAYQQIEDRVGLSLDELLQLPQGELCFAVVEAPEGPPVVVVFFDVRDKVPLADKLMARVFEQLGTLGVDLQVETHQGTDITVLRVRQGGMLCLFHRDGTFVITSNVQFSQQLLDLWSGGQADVRTLADNPAFGAIMQQSVGTKDERPQLSWFVDPIGLYRNIARGDLTMQATLAFLNPLGLDAVEGLGGSVIMAAEEFDTITHFHILVRSPRRAIPKMIALVAGDNEPESWVPQDVVSYTTLHWDVNTTIKELQTLYDLIRLQDGAFAELVQQRLSTPLGVDILADVVPLLEGRITTISMVERPVRINSNVTLVAAKVKDLERFQTLLQQVIDKYSTNLEKKSFGSVNYYRIIVPEPRNFNPELLRRPEPALAMIDDYVVISDSVKFLEKCLATREMTGTSLSDDPEYKLVAARMRRHLGGRTPALVTFSRPEESMRWLYDLAQQQLEQGNVSRLAERSRFFQAIDSALQEHPLPPFAALARYLAPTGAVVASDETGFHYVGFTVKR